MNIDLNSIILAFVLSLIAGLSTGLGGCIALFAKNTNTRFLSSSLGFSAGVMIYLSLVEILNDANQLLGITFGDKRGTAYSLIGFFCGMLLVVLIKRLFPEDIKVNKFIANDLKMKTKLYRTGLLTAFAIALHNFPEGIASFISSIHSLKHAIPIVIAIALHNIPEGVSVSTPIYYATDSKERAFFYSLLSGMAEPLGAFIGYLVLMPFINNTIFGLLYSAIAGIMVYISFDELLPTAREYGKQSLVISGLVMGMVFMAISLWLFI